MSTSSFTINEKGIAILTIDKPPMNALSAEVLQDLDTTFTTALLNDNVRVVVITGAGTKAFVAGADITEIDKVVSQSEAAPFVAQGQELFTKIEQSHKPVIAALNGFTLGGGLELAMACHIRIADKGAKLGLPEIKLGIIPGFGGTQRLPRLIGKASALELILTGDFIPAEKALELGLVNRVTAEGTSVDAALALAENIASKGRPAIQAALRAVLQGSSLPLDKGLDIERDEFSALCETENKKEGIKAFLEKRDPVPKDN
jgi:enoyl-CoA hydratase